MKFFILTLFLSLSVFAKENPMALLNKSIQGTDQKLQISAGKGTLIYIFCGDKKVCEKIEFPNTVKMDLAEDYVFLHYGLVSKSKYFEGFQKDQIKEIQSVVSKHSKECKKDEAKNDCALRNLSEKLKPVIK